MEPIIKYKSDYWWGRLLGMYSATALYPNLYVPNRIYILTQAELRRKMVIMGIQRDYGLVPFIIRYALPTPVALVSFLSIFAIVNPAALWFLVFMAALLPIWPTPYRLKCQISAWVAASTNKSIHLDEIEEDNRQIYNELQSWRYWGATRGYASQYILRLIRQEKKRQQK